MRFAPGTTFAAVSLAALWTAGAVWTGALLMAPGAARAEEEPEPEFQPRREAREILATLDGPTPEKEPFYTRFHVSHKRGLEYRDTIGLRGQKLSLKLYGPVVKKNVGLGLRLRGLRVADQSVSVKAYGTAKKQGFRLEVEF